MTGHLALMAWSGGCAVRVGSGGSWCARAQGGEGMGVLRGPRSLTVAGAERVGREDRAATAGADDVGPT